MSLRGFSSENRGRTFSKDQSQRHDTSAPAFATLVRPSHAQAPAVLDHSRTLPQGDGGAGPAFAGGAEGGERDLVILAMCSTILSPSGVHVSTRKVK